MAVVPLPIYNSVQLSVAFLSIMNDFLVEWLASFPCVLSMSIDLWTYTHALVLVGMCSYFYIQVSTYVFIYL